MRVKVGNKWYQPREGKPVAVELSDRDKLEIQHMNPGDNRYGQFAEDDPMDDDDRIAWMRDEDQ